ncbi:4'-phosphopantetheinyl transferase superfamily protein [Lacrimispora sp. BS-2]|uniref:4'-phosphopantetheinyl transferase superfamily protein n=1 Tax=Lacrimispora sp. BS-2 TaxID=3151850 RepID=A0AAU7PSQ1_9FIRM
MVRIYLERYETSQEKKKWEQEHELGKKLLHTGLKDLYGIGSELQNQPVILQGEHGKPYLKDFPDIHYNISHTDGMVACAIGDRQLGIDVERIRPFRQNILKKVFSDAERHRMEEISEEDRSQYFFQIWTLKESYLKATGLGITIPLTTISFEWKEEAFFACSVPGASFHQTMLEGDYVLSICTIGDEEINFGQNLVFSDKDESL